ncbi:MAG: hypothetical protein SGILL_005330, partial [Bacillariaceae sp.]
MSAVSPVARLFVIAGQSNTLGFASLEHLLRLDNPGGILNYRYTLPTASGPLYITQDNVFVSFDREYGDRRPTTLEGVLQADAFGASASQFGPEVGFGFRMGELFGEDGDFPSDDPIIILKAGGVSALALDWNAPNGDFYTTMVDDINDTLSRISTITNGAASEGELCGVVWFHGYADVFEPDFLAAYENNLQDWIDSIRADTNNPDLPIVIGQMGGDGLIAGPEENQMRSIQTRVVSQNDNAGLGLTARYNSGFDEDDPNEVFDEFFHYYGRADVIENVGIEFANIMVSLLPPEKLQLEPVSDSPSVDATLSEAPTTTSPVDSSGLPSPSPSDSPNTSSPSDSNPTLGPTTKLPTTAAPVEEGSPTTSPVASPPTATDASPPPTTTGTTPPPTTMVPPPPPPPANTTYPLYGPEAFLNAGRPMNHTRPKNIGGSSVPLGSKSSKSRGKDKGGKGSKSGGGNA